MRLQSYPFLLPYGKCRKKKIVHFSINSYDIGKGLSDEFPDFKLLFGDDALADNVMVLKGGFMNVGRNDITGLKGKNDIKLIFPDGCIVKAFTISPSTEDLKVTANKDNEKENILNFCISEIFKTDEYFKYTAIIETSEEMKSLHSVLKFSHRLSNTEKIRNILGSQSDEHRRKFIKSYIYSMVLIMLIMAGFFSYQELSYNIYKKANNQEVKIHIDPYSNLYVHEGEGLPIPFISGNKISSNELEKEYIIVPVTEFRWSGSMFLGMWVLAIICLLFVYYTEWRGNAHIMNVLKENERRIEKM